MNTEILGIVVVFVLTVLIAIPLGKYCAKIFAGTKTWTDFLAPLENMIFKFSGVDPGKNMDWKENVRAMLTMNLVFFLLAMVILLTQSWHPFWNPGGIGSMEPTLAFNTAISFLANTNLQHYSGETGASYFSQLLVFCFLQFMSAGTGIAALALLFNGLARGSKKQIGNFYSLLVKSCTRILLPIAFVIALILVWEGSPSTFAGAETVVTLEGDTVKVARGPVAPMVAIKQVGTNGGGFFGPNSTHPFENPTYLTNIIENFALLIVAISLVFAFGFFMHRPKLGYMYFATMTLLFLFFVIVAVSMEVKGNPKITAMGIDNSLGNMEGKEMRIGAAASAFWGVSTTATSTGAVNSMHDSQMPLAGAIYMLDMMINALYGGVGVGFINFFVFIVIGVFISGLMVGRTPELFGKKIEAKEVKIAAIVAIAHPFLILVSTAIASATYASNPDIGWLNNPSYHGFSEMLYEFTSSAANNGSGFEGLADNTPFWNILCGLIMLFARFIPIIGPLAIVGSLASKKYIPESAGTLRVDSVAFNAVLICVIIIMAALSFFPALTLGPIAEYLSL
jgi:K+-transporting ATPase ATPase A chain